MEHVRGSCSPRLTDATGARFGRPSVRGGGGEGGRLPGSLSPAHSWAVQRGASLHELKGLLGHSSLAVVMRYAHIAPENLCQAVNKAGGVLAEVVRGETADAV